MTEAGSSAPGKTALVTFLLDRSYSMQHILAATLEGFNGYLSGLQAEPDAAIDFTLVTFDDQSIDPVHVGIPIGDVPMLTETTYVPRGGTPLVEAAIKTISATAEAVGKRTDSPRVVMCIQTDGQENASGSEYTSPALKALVEEKQAAGWEFNFLGSGIDVYAVAGHYGFREANTMSYNANDIEATRTAFQATASHASSYASGRVASTAYSTADRIGSGDAYWDKKAVKGAGGLAEQPVVASSNVSSGVSKPGSKRGSTIGSVRL